eukprot:s1080_g5.t1
MLESFVDVWLSLEVAMETRLQTLIYRPWLPRDTFDSTRHKDLVECEICLVEYEDGDELIRLPCLHLFHVHCVTPWLQKSHCCPVCQLDVMEAYGLNS